MPSCRALLLKNLDRLVTDNKRLIIYDNETIEEMQHRWEKDEVVAAHRGRHRAGLSGQRGVLGGHAAQHWTGWSILRPSV